MRPILFALPLLAATALAQTASSTQSRAVPSMSTTNLESISIPDNCPVNMTARQQSGGQTMWTIALDDAAKRGSEASPKPAGTGVHVELKAAEGDSIRQVELAVHYLAPGWRVTPVKEAKPGDELKKTYNLAGSDGGSLHLAADLLVGSTGGITRVTLLRIDYANGTSWRASKQQECSVAPNGFMLVGAR